MITWGVIWAFIFIFFYPACVAMCTDETENTQWGLAFLLTILFPIPLFILWQLTLESAKKEIKGAFLSYKKSKDMSSKIVEEVKSNG